MRNILITGGKSGIVLQTALKLGKEGNQIIINGISEEQKINASKTLDDANIKYEIFLFDVTKEEEVNESMEKIEKKYAKLDTIINCAGGLGGRSPIEEMDTKFFRFVMALNLDSAFFVTRAGLNMLKKGDNASIVNFTSNAGWNAGGPGAGIYGTSKAAVTTLTRAMAKEFAAYNIRVNAVSPGTLDTPFHDQIKKTKPEVFAGWKNNILLKRLGEPEEVANVINFLISDDASFLTGEIIQVNGGQDFI